MALPRIVEGWKGNVKVAGITLRSLRRAGCPHFNPAGNSRFALELTAAGYAGFSGPMFKPKSDPTCLYPIAL
jgi:hypothetical protein